MEGYGFFLIYALIAYPAFQIAYGEPLNPDAPPDQQNYHISPAWKPA